jgi:hypothetical protein
MWSPDPAELVAFNPVAVGMEIFRAPDVFIKVLNVIPKSLGEIAFALVYPVVNGIVWTSGMQLPIAGIVTGENQFGRTPVEEREA